MSGPPFETVYFGIGAEKAATSWLDSYLAGHPGVATPEIKELNYWNTIRPPHVTWPAERIARRRAARPAWLRAVFAHLPLGRLHRREVAFRTMARSYAGGDPGHAAYTALLRQRARGEMVGGEICPGYALLESATYAEMDAYAGGARFIFQMRDPVKRLISSARMRLRLGEAEGFGPEDLDAYLRHVCEGRGGHELRHGRYDLTLAALEAVIPAERILPVFYERLFSQAEVDRITGFLGLAPHPARLDRKVNSARRAGPPLSEETRARMRAVTAPVYAFVADRFGAQVPESWDG